MKVNFDDFSVGDLISFKKKFSLRDFSHFSVISGDQNPLHHDKSYAQSSGHGENIVPLHLIIAPISRVAGMNFPGVPSLYLGHSVRAVRQLRYGEVVNYSAKINALNASKRIIDMRVMGFCGLDVIFDAKVQVQALHGEWIQEPDIEISPSSRRKRVLITGASGEIARSLADIFSKNDWQLMLQSRGFIKKTAYFAQNKDLSRVEFVEADLQDQKNLEQINKRIAGHNDIHAIIHVASPPVNAHVNDLIDVNYSALKSLAETALPQMLANQEGLVMSIGSSAALTHQHGFDAYAAAKSMAASYLARLDKKYSAYGVKGRVLAPTFVSTEYSKQLRGEQSSLMPYEVAEQAFKIVQGVDSFMTVQQVGYDRSGNYGFHIDKLDENKSIDTFADKIEQFELNESNLSDTIVSVLKRIFPDCSVSQITNGGLDSTPGWDSLAQIRVVLEVEKITGVTFSTQEFETLTTFAGLLNSCKDKLRK